MIDSCYSFQHMHTCRPVFEVQIELFAAQLPTFPTWLRYFKKKKKRTFCHGNQRNFRANVSCWKAFFLMSWLTGRKFIQPCREWGKKGKAVLLSFISDTEVFRMRWLKTAQNGTAEVQYLVSFCLFQWTYISNVGRRRQKARFVLQCSFRQMFEEGISEAPLQFLKSYV